MNVFTNVSSQVSGLGSSLGSWFKKEGQEGQEDAAATDQQQQQQGEGQAGDLAAAAPAPAPPAPADAPKKRVKAAADDDNDDAASNHSGATEGADSNPPSETEEEQEAKSGFASGLGFNLSAVQGKASASAKSVGSFFSSAFSKAGASVKEAGSKIKETVEKNTLLSEFNKEQEAFIKAKGGKGGEALPPWVGYPDEDALKEEILALATDRRNFVRNPPAGVNFEFDLECFLPVAQATLAADPNLDKMRFELVPKTIDEETFWRNYFYRVGLIRQSTELSSLEREGVEGSAKPTGADTVKGGKEQEPEPPQQQQQQPDSPSQGQESEFVSDTMQPSNKDVEEVRKGVSSLTKPSSEEDWERELQEELGEYEVVGGADGTAKDSDKWEAEIQDMIDDESDLR